MAKDSVYTRKVTSGNITKVFSKKFEIKDAKSIEKANKYEKRKSYTTLSGEVLQYKIDKRKKEIEFLNIENFPLTKWKAKGTIAISRIKGIYKSSGSFKTGFSDSIRELIVSIPNVKELNIDYSKDSKSSIRKSGSDNILTLSQNDYNYVHGLYEMDRKLTVENSKIEILKYLKTKLPKISLKESSSKPIVSLDFKNLIFNDIIDNLSESEVTKLVFELYEKHLKSFESNALIFKEADTKKLEFIIGEYKNHLDKHSDDESKWQKLYEKYFHIINPSYKYVIREVDTIFKSLDIKAKSRPVDFIAVDLFNNIELIELKTPYSEIISKTTDRNNYYLKHNCTKACTQLEKYLLCFERNHIEVERLVKRKISEKYGILQKDINIITTRPKAKLITGLISPITKSRARHQDLQLQRHSFKNIELITYDEIYRSLIEIKQKLEKRTKQ